MVTAPLSYATLQEVNYMPERLDYENIACALYDGGWRHTDSEEIAIEYGFDEHQADEICACIKVIEEYKQNGE